MNKGMIIVIGMTISYLFSLGGLLFAWSFYRRNKKAGATERPKESNRG